VVRFAKATKEIIQIIQRVAMAGLLEHVLVGGWSHVPRPSMFQMVSLRRRCQYHPPLPETKQSSNINRKENDFQNMF
jgi:hypothetical protein